MTAQWADFPSGNVGLYGYDTAKMLDGIWAEIANSTSLSDDPDPNIGAAGRVLFTNPAANLPCVARKVLTGVRTTVGMSARMFLPFLPSNVAQQPTPFVFSDISNNPLFVVSVEPTGALTLSNVVAGTSYTTPGPIITAAAWTHLSCKIVVSTTVGSITLEREGLPVFSQTGLNTGVLGIAQVSHYNKAQNTGANTPMYIKDSFIWDGLGTVNNTHPGPVTVYRETVNADVSSGWSRTSGTSDYNLLDDSPPVDTNYISAGFSPLPAPSIMRLQDLPPDVVSVRAAFLVGRQRKSDGGDCQTQMSLSPDGGANWYNGADRAITTAFTYQFDCSELSPATGVPWTPVEINNATIKINRTV